MTDILMRPFVALQVAVFELRQREDGQTTTEYAILLGFLAIAIIIALFFLRDRPAQPVLGRGSQRLERAELSTRLHIDAGMRRLPEPAHAAFDSSSDGSRQPVSPATGLGRTRLLGGCPIDPEVTGCVGPRSSDGQLVTCRGCVPL